MTDKQIIIDGVDISKCKHYDEIFNYCDQSYLGEGGLLKNTKNPKRCECSPNCYFKQLARKTQECEEFKYKIKYMEEYIKTVENARDEFERENKFSKEEREQAEQKLERIKDIASKVLLNTHNLEQFKDADALFGSLLEIYKIIDEMEEQC